MCIRAVPPSTYMCKKQNVPKYIAMCACYELMCARFAGDTTNGIQRGPFSRIFEDPACMKICARSTNYCVIIIQVCKVYSTTCGTKKKIDSQMGNGQYYLMNLKYWRLLYELKNHRVQQTSGRRMQMIRGIFVRRFFKLMKEDTLTLFKRL